MTTDEVKLLTPRQRFWYWCRERHQIHLRRRAGLPKPWTDDEVLRTVFFTNPYRENDKVTVWFRDAIRDPLRDHPDVLFATVCFRWFNLPETGEILGRTGLLTDWRPDVALFHLDRVRKAGGKVFTGAYMINSPAGEPKLEAIVRRVTNVWKDVPLLLSQWDLADGRMETMWTELTRYDGMGGFMAYEIVCDLRHTYLLENAEDVNTWCNPGPGCIRGLYRLAGEEWASKGNNATAPPRPKDWLDRMKNLLAESRRRLTRMPPFEMREVEHSLCEFDKYERVLWGDGRAKRTYAGG